MDTFTAAQIEVVNHAADMAEEQVSNHFKMSATQWLRQKYDIKTLRDLAPAEIVQGPFAQIIRYEGRPKNGNLGSDSFDFYKICIQDPAIMAVLKQNRGLQLLPFGLYIITHELIHVVRFIKFLQNFEASPKEKMAEEVRVHRITRDILQLTQVPHMEAVFQFYRHWHQPLEKLGLSPENLKALS